MVDANFAAQWYPPIEYCRLCRSEITKISGVKKYCVVCYKEIIINAILHLQMRS